MGDLTCGQAGANAFVVIHILEGVMPPETLVTSFCLLWPRVTAVRSAAPPPGICVERVKRPSPTPLPSCLLDVEVDRVRAREIR